MVKIKKLHVGFRMPSYTKDGDACMDVPIPYDITIDPYTVKIIPLGFALEIPPGFEVQLRMRSGLSCKYPNYMANGIGTIDCNYRDEVGLIFNNNTFEPARFKEGDRVCQMMLNKLDAFWLVPTKELNKDNDRGGGYGSTGS